MLVSTPAPQRVRPSLLLDLDVGNGRRFFAGAQGVLAVIRDFEARHARGAEPVDQRRQRAVAFAGKLDRLAVAEQSRAAADHAIRGSRFRIPELPGRRALDVFAPEHALQLGAADFAAEAVHLLVGDRAELALHFLGQFDAEFVLQQVGDAALAGLAVDANDLAVFAADVGRINRQIRHVPVLLGGRAPTRPGPS